MCVTVPAHRNYKVANHKAVPVTVYDYYNRIQTARMFYEPTLARSCDICDGDECSESCNTVTGKGSEGGSGQDKDKLQIIHSSSTKRVQIGSIIYLIVPLTGFILTLTTRGILHLDH